MIFGEFDLVLGFSTDQLPQEFIVAMKALYFMFALLIPLLLLNLLIAIMGNSYSKVQENTETEWRGILLDILVEIENYEMWMRFINPFLLFNIWSGLWSTKKFSPKWINILTTTGGKWNQTQQAVATPNEIASPPQRE